MAARPFQLSLLLCAGLAFGLTGCAAMRPLSGIPASKLPDEFRAPNRSAKRTIDLSLLRQTPPDAHRVDTGDVLGVYVEGFLGGRQQSPPVNFPQNPNSSSSVGYPIRVRANGTISLPGRKPISVRGMTIAEVETAVRRAYTTGDKPPIKPGFERVLVTLHRPRHYRVLVIRQEAAGNDDVAGVGGQSAVTTGKTPSGKRGTGRVVNLPAYKNDVLNALAATGGLPGLDAENVIYVIRRRDSHRTPGVPAPGAPPATPQFVPAVPPAPGPQLPATQNAAPLGVRNFETSDSKQIRELRRLVIRGQSPGVANRTAAGYSPPSLREAAAPRIRITDVASGHTAVPRPKPGFSNRFASGTRSPAVGRSTSSRRSRASSRVRTVSAYGMQPVPDFAAAVGMPVDQRQVVRIPLRTYPGQPPAFSEADIILEDGDIVLIESRASDVFYTGGLLGGGRFLLPRDQDLDVLQALALVQTGRVAVLPTRAIGGISAVNQDVTASASNLIVLRTLPGGGQMRICVDLYKALKDPRERIYVQPGDHLILRYKHYEAVAAFFERNILDGAVLGVSSGLFFNN